MMRNAWIVLLVLVGCGEGALRGTCQQPFSISAVSAASTSAEAMVSGDTSGAEIASPSPACRPRSVAGKAEAAPIHQAPQVVFSYEVPGQGLQVVRFTTATRGTLPSFDTIVEVRRQCDEAASLCFDDTKADIRASGSFGAAGGETLFLVVTGFGREGLDDRVDRGPLQLEVSSRPNRAPTLDSAVAALSSGRVSISVKGRDPDADVIGLKAVFYRHGQRVDLNSDGVVDEQDQLVERLADNDAIELDVTWIEPLPTAPQASLAQVLQRAEADEVEIWLLDEGREQSNSVKAKLARQERMKSFKLRSGFDRLDVDQPIL